MKNRLTTFRFFGALLAITFLVNPDAWSQFAKRKEVDVGVEEVKREKTQTKAKNQLNRSAAFQVEVQEKLMKGIDKTLKFYRRQVNRLAKGSPARLTIQMRILDLNLEQAAYVRSKEERLYDRRWTAWDAGGRRGPQPNIDTKRSFGYWKNVIQQADRIMAEYPKNRSADKVLFTKGFAFSFIGQEKDAARIYTQLTQAYPNSSVAGDAYASLGDYYFDRNDFRNAMNNYSRALKYRRSDRYLWSIFKIGWCNYNLGKHRTALNYWKKVVSLSGRGGKSGLMLKEEALRDMVYAFAELKDVKGAIAYYRANGGGEYIGSLLKLLAEELANDGNYPEAIKTHKLFQKLLATNPEAPQSQKDLLLLLYELGKLKVLWQEIVVLKRLYGGNGRWASANAKDRRLVLETQKMVKDQILYYAKVLHKRGQKSENDIFYRQAKVGYSMFLQDYPKAKEVVEVKNLLADIEFALTNYRAAGQLYLDITERGPKRAIVYDPESGKPTENIHKEAATYMVDAYARDFQAEFKALQKRKTDFSKRPRPLSPRAKSYIRACQTYLKFYPKDQKLEKSCDTDIARIYYYSNDKENSRKYLAVIAFKYPNDKKLGPKAVEDLIPLYKDDKPRLLELADKLLKVPAYKKGELGDKLRALKRGAEKETVAKIKDDIKRAKAFENLAKKNPRDPESDKMLRLAGESYLDGGDIGSSIGAYLFLIKRYPKSSLVQQSLLDVAQLYEKKFDLDTAASYFRLYAEKFPKDNKAKGALAKSCDLLLALDSGKARTTCMAFVKRHPQEGKDVVNRLIISAQRAKRYSEMSSLITGTYLKLNLTPNERIIAYNRIYTASGRKGSAASSILNEFKRAGSDNVSGEALRYVGQILFAAANAKMPEYSRLKLAGGDQNRLQASILKKNQALSKLEAGYAQVANTGDSYWGVAAFHQLGIAYEQFHELLADPPTIAGAKKSEVVAALAGDAAAFRKKALTFYKDAFGLVQKFQVYNEWSPRVITAFYRITDQPFTFDDYVVDPDFVGSEVSSSIVSEIKVGR